MFGVHYDTTENNFDFESVNPDNPFNEDDDDGEPIIILWHIFQLHSTLLSFIFLSYRHSFKTTTMMMMMMTMMSK